MKIFANKVSVITGAASGLGRELAIQLSNLGSIVAIADIDENGLQETSRIIIQAGGSVTPYLLDVSKRDDVYAFAEKVISDYEQVDVLINNAGVSLKGDVEELSYENLEWIIGINTWGVIYCTKAFFSNLKKQPEANIVNISSVFGLIGVAGKSAYCASKFAVKGFTESLRQELYHTNVAVSIVHPGSVATNIIRNRRIQNENDRIKTEKYVKRFDEIAKTSASGAAKIVIKGIKKNKPRILIGSDSRLISLLGRCLPGRYDRIALNQIARKLEVD